jgi:putative PIN family toxin of toxin-antitoxin system
MKRLRRGGLKKRKPVRAVIDTNLFIRGLFATQGYSFQLQQLWVAGAFELAVSEQILNEIENTLVKPHIRKRLFLEDGEQDMQAWLERLLPPSASYNLNVRLRK